MATVLPRALPPMVRPEMRAVTPTLISTDSTPKAAWSRTTMTAAVVPLTMPQISPTTSLQTLETRPALRRSISASAAPFSLWEAMEWKGLGSAAVTATPMMSNKMPRPMNTASTESAAAMPAPERVVSDAMDSAAERTMASTNTSAAQRYWELRPGCFRPPARPLEDNEKTSCQEGSHTNSLSRRRRKR